VTSEYGRGSAFTATVLQTRGGDKKLASVQGAVGKRVLVFEERPICLDALVYAMTTLGVYPVCAQSPAEFKLALANGGFDFAFVPSKYVADCAFTLGKSKSLTTLVSMTELGEVSSYSDAHSIMLPIFCTGIANVLNNAPDHAPSGGARRAYFLAPDVKVLIVDDISTNLRVSKELMALYGMDIHTCLSGVRAVELARTNHYDIIFMDHMMPDMDGVEATAAIRATDENDPYYQKLPIIALTANAVVGQREMFLQNGMNDFLAKPIEMQKLDAVLKEWIPEEKRRRPPAAESGAAKETERLGFFEIEGVSVEAGLRNSGGSVAAYADILLDFCRDADERAEQIERCLREDNIGLYLTLVHALKGAARSVGAAEFAEFAARMEEAAQNRDTDIIATMTGKMLTALHRLTNEIRRALDDRLAGDETQAADFSAARLEHLKAALLDMDIAVVNELMMEYAGISLNSKARKELSEIERLILLFEYDAAIRRIDLLIGATPEK
jgi:CheY-like chemotaxis protein